MASVMSNGKDPAATVEHLFHIDIQEECKCKELKYLLSRLLMGNCWQYAYSRDLLWNGAGFV